MICFDSGNIDFLIIDGNIDLEKIKKK